MKIRKTLLSFAWAIMVALSFTACGDDWGRQDDPAGGQIYPSKTTVATYDFEYSEEKPEYSDMISHDESCEVTNDESLASNVLHINGKGGAKIANPFNGVKLQNGAAITFAVKIDAAVAEDGTVADVDLTRPLISFGSDEKDAAGNDISARFYITANGQVVYNKPTQLQSLNLNENDPSSVKTGILSPNEWHFVALQLSTEGYQLYVDGKKSLSGYQTSSSATSFQYKTLVDSINSLPYIYIGGDSKLTAEETNTVSIDDVTLIRNMMEEKDWNKVPTGNGGSTEDEAVYVPVGPEDCSAAWWSAWSDYFVIPANQTFHTKFINHTSGADNWHNWNLVVATDADRGAAGYSEYFVLRSDLFGWGNADYNADNITNEGYGDWEQFKKNMEGATVDMTVERRGAEVYVTAVATCKDGTVYKEMYHQPCAADGNIRAFLACDHSYLQLNAAETFVGEEYASGSALVGPADCSAAWWTAFSKYYPLNSSISDDCPFVIQFVNNNSGSGKNWNNWLVVCSTADRGGDGYFENFVIRSDAYAWFGAGGNINENTANLDFKITQSFNFDSYVNDMHGAMCYLKFTRSGNSLTMDAKQRKENGEYMPDFQFQFNSMKEGNAGFFLTAELASLDVLKAGYFPYYKLLFENK